MQNPKQYQVCNDNQWAINEANTISIQLQVRSQLSICLSGMLKTNSLEIGPFDSWLLGDMPMRGKWGGNPLYHLVRPKALLYIQKGRNYKYMVHMVLEYKAHVLYTARNRY